MSEPESAHGTISESREDAGDLIICRCEEVDVREIMQVIDLYKCSAREVKLRTRAGMGYCGGRVCRPALNALLADVAEGQPNHELPLKVQPPVRPMTLAALGTIEQLEGENK